MNQSPIMPISIFNPSPHEEAPARVRMAMDFLVACTMKTMVRGMVNNVGFDTISGQHLTEEESVAQATACNLLASYFRGKLSPSVFEQKASVEEKSSTVPGMLMRCFSCEPGPGQPGCAFCHGCGDIIVYPRATGV